MISWTSATSANRASSRWRNDGMSAYAST
jgi:hypothetical protein